MNVWNKKIEAESNSYNWLDKPKIISSLKKEKNDFIHIDLFSGCGGFSEGFHQAGFKTEIAIDIHPPSMETLLNNHKSTNGILGDIKKVKENTINDLISNKKSIKVLTAGVPCQGFSLSNRKRHSEDKRNYLFKEFIRIAKFINPDAVILENVSGLASTKDGFFKKNISKAISDLGFDVSFSLINSADYKNEVDKTAKLESFKDAVETAKLNAKEDFKATDLYAAIEARAEIQATEKWMKKQGDLKGLN